MPLINTPVPNLIQGVSQQPDATRFAGQCEEQENALSSVAGGLKKRPNTRHVAKLLTSAIDSNSFVHFIDRSDTEKYCITQDNNTLRINNALTGEQCAITEQGSTDFSITNNEVDTTGTYLESSSAINNIKPLTVGDSTFLLNTDKTTGLDPTTATPPLSNSALIFIKQGDYSKKYGFKIEGRQREGNGASAIINVGETIVFNQSAAQQGINALTTNSQGIGYVHGISLPSSGSLIQTGGSGFAVNDVVNVTLIPSFLAHNPDPNEPSAEAPITIFETPQIRVIGVDSNGTITSASVENAGAYIYSASEGYVGVAYEGGYSSISDDVVVNSSNSLSVGISGAPATIEVQQMYKVNALPSSGARMEIDGVRLANANAGGTGFGVGDVLSITLPASQLTGVTTPVPDEIIDDETGRNFLNVITTPTVIVTSVDSNGTITGLQVNESGQFGYGDNSGEEAKDSNMSPILLPYPQYFNATSFPSTNSTAVSVQADTSFTSSRFYVTPDSSPETNAEFLDSSSILNNLVTGGGTAISTNFDRDGVHTNSNLLIVKPKVITTTGLDQVASFQISPIDGLGGGGIGVVHREVSSISDLPLVAPHGYRVKVMGDAELSQDDFYCEFNLSSDEAVDGDVGQGTWVECAGAIVNDEIDASKMPRQLVNVAPNVFEIRRMVFGALKAGDENSNPAPSFIGNKISNVFQYKNRLGFLSLDSISLSESGFGGFNSILNRQEFNFFRTTVTTLIDSDPIDVSVASNRVTNLKSAKGFQENLILFSENGQFVLKGGELLTPRTVSVTPITNFIAEDRVDPLPLGSYIYFPFTRGNFTGMREFTVNASTDNYDSTEITEHVPAYIPKNVIDIAGTTSEDIIALLSGDEKSSLYIYNYFWNNNQKVLSAWSKFTFAGEIRGIEFIESTLYAVIVNNVETHLVEMPLESGLKDDAGYVTHLDMRVAKTVTNGANTIDLSSDFTPADNSVEVYTTDGLKLNANNSGATVTLTQAVTADTSVFVGIPYTMKYTFSEQLFKAKAGQGTSPSNAAKLLIRNGSIYFDETAHFKVKVTPKFRSTYENIFTPNVVGSTTIGTLNLDSGFYRFPVLTKAQDTTITIENDSALPSNFQSAEFESFVHSRSNRYG